MQLPEYVTINGTRHASANLNEAARTQVLNIQVAEVEIARLRQQLALAQTARNAYFGALMTELRAKNQASAADNKPKKPRASRKKSAEAGA